MGTHADQIQTIMKIMQDDAQKPVQQPSAPVFNFNGGGTVGTINVLTGPVNLVMAFGTASALNTPPAALPGQAV